MLKKLASIVFAITLVISASTQSYGQSGLNIISDTAVLMDAATGQILYEKNMHKIKEPASITKIPTVYLSVINSSSADAITVSKTAGQLPYGVTHVSLLPGEQVTMGDVQHAAMLMSANDACNVIAEHISGNNQNFAKEMNDFAKSAGAINTNFINPHGLPEKGHVTTAYDMAMITKAAIQNSDFLKIFSTVTYSMPENNLQPSRPFASQDESMKKNNANYYSGIIGGKLGWTEEARHTKVTVAERDGRTLIAVVMDDRDPKSKYADTKALFDYGFSQFVKHTVTPSVFGNKTLLVKDGVNSAGEINIFMPSGCEILLHKSMSKDDILIEDGLPQYIELSDVETAEFSVTIKVPQTSTMYPCEIKLPLQTRFTPGLSKAITVPMKLQLEWLGKEVLKVSGISLGIMAFVFIVIIVILLIRKYTILMMRSINRRKKQKRQREIAKQKAAQKRRQSNNTANSNNRR